jgi:hypothetical protein
MRPPRKEICDCGILERCSKEPGHPVRYDPEMGEYFIAHGSGGSLMIYYCPFCGGKTPESLRASKFAHVSDAEQSRICNLFRGITTEEQVRNTFGKPDREQDIGMITISPEKNGQASRGEAFRTLTYSNLSPVAEVEFHISDNGRARGTWIQKYIGNKSGQPAAGEDRHARPGGSSNEKGKSAGDAEGGPSSKPRATP